MHSQVHIYKLEHQIFRPCGHLETIVDAGQLQESIDYELEARVKYIVQGLAVKMLPAWGGNDTWLLRCAIVC